MKHLRTILLTEEMFAPVEATVNRIFYREIFEPLLAALKADGIEITNDKPVGLERALADGTVYYDSGAFFGRFNVSISKELRGMGATFDKRNSSWRLPTGAALPARLQIAVAEANARSRKAINSVISTLDNIHVVANVDLDELAENYGTGLWRMNKEFVAATQAIAMVPEFTEASKERIAKEWATNLNLYIVDWEKEAILGLRQKVEANTMRGQRAENLVKMIQETHGVSKTKAHFLARQETSLLVSKMREERFTSIGCETYTWRGVDDARERPDHKMLNGTIHNWNSPPVTNRQTGARNNPGEDFGCRCLAIPNLKEALRG